VNPKKQNHVASNPRRAFLGGLFLGGLGGTLAIRFSLRGGSTGSDAKSDKYVNPQPPDLDHAHFMRLAIEQAKKVPKLPFGALIVDSRSSRVLAEGHNRSLDSPIFHGEIDVINRLAASPERPEDWGPLVLYTTAEPCPMCQSAIAWAGIGATVFGSSIPFLQDLGWWQIDIRAEEVIRRTPFRRIALLGGVLEDECNALFLAVPRGMYRDKK
jgi:tRNA(adenine34) deaminase